MVDRIASLRRVEIRSGRFQYRLGPVGSYPPGWPISTRIQSVLMTWLLVKAEGVEGERRDFGWVFRLSRCSV